jgi:hypothetical protein
MDKAATSEGCEGDSNNNLGQNRGHVQRLEKIFKALAENPKRQEVQRHGRTGGGSGIPRRTGHRHGRLKSVFHHASDAGNLSVCTLARAGLPAWLPEITIRNLHVGRSTTDIRFYRKSQRTHFDVLDQRGKLHVLRQPIPWSLTTRLERLKDVMEG